jgi:hypothetical protein
MELKFEKDITVGSNQYHVYLRTMETIRNELGEVYQSHTGCIELTVADTEKLIASLHEALRSHQELSNQ